MATLDSKISGPLLALTRDTAFTQLVVDQADGFNPWGKIPESTLPFDSSAYTQDGVTTTQELFAYLNNNTNLEIGGSTHATLGSLLVKYGLPVLNQFNDFDSQTTADESILRAQTQMVAACQTESAKTHSAGSLEFELDVAKKIFERCFSQRGHVDDPLEGTALSLAQSGLGFCTEKSELFSAICRLANFEHLQIGYADVRIERDGSVMKMPNGDYVRHVCNFILVRETSKVFMADLSNSTDLAEGWNTSYPEWKPLSDTQMESVYFSNRGTSLLDQKRFSEAQESLETALSLDDHNAEAYNGLANLYLMQGKERLKSDKAGASAAFAKASELFSQGLAAEPNHILLLTDFGHLKTVTGDFSAAEDLLGQATQQDPAYIPAQLNLVIAQFKQGKVEEAKRGIGTVLALDPANATALAMQSRLSIVSE